MTASAKTLLFTAIVMMGACAPAASRTLTSPLPEPPVGDAALLRTHCMRAAPAARMDCYNTGILATMRVQGIPAALTQLDRLTAIDEDVKRDGHMYAHSMGLAAYRNPETMSATFRQCLPTFQSGCYHGVIQAYFAEVAGKSGADALNADVVNDLCRDYRGTPEGDWLLFQCVHGMGHGLSQINEHDLKATLGGCDKLIAHWEREGCYGGAFMENVQQAFAPHHGVGRPDPDKSKTSMAGMDHSIMPGMDHGAPPAAGVKLVDPADPLYPCSALPDKYLESCYMMQTSVVLTLNHGDFADAARTCDKVTTKYRGVCYQSLGRDVSSWTLQDFPRAVTLCSTGDTQYQPWCHVGFVKNVIDVSADYRTGLPYCRMVTGDAAKTACYRAIGEEIGVLAPDDTKRTAACADVESAYRQACVTASGVRPPGQSK